MEDSMELIVDNVEPPINNGPNHLEDQHESVAGEALKTASKPTKHVRLPVSKIRHIMKMDPDVTIIQQEAVFLVCKATEMFIELLTRETGKQLSGNKRKTVMRRDVDLTIENIPQLCFLDGALE